jgi:hypothetical protein
LLRSRPTLPADHRTVGLVGKAVEELGGIAVGSGFLPSAIGIHD